MSFDKRLDALEKENKVLQGKILANTMVFGCMLSNVIRKNRKGLEELTIKTKDENVRQGFDSCLTELKTLVDNMVIK